MKKLVILLLSIVFVTACSASSEEDAQKEQEQEPIFTEEDIDLAKEMIQYAQELEEDFVVTANEDYKNKINENPERYNSDEFGSPFDEDKFMQDFKPLSKEKILDPFIEKYGQHVVGKENTELESRVNVSHFSQTESEDSNGEKLEERQFFPTYENLTLKEPVIEYYELYGVHELVLPIDMENTTSFNDVEGSPILDKITFYKTEEGELLIGKFEYLKGNQYYHVNTANDEYSKDTQEDLNNLPSLK